MSSSSPLDRKLWVTLWNVPHAHLATHLVTFKSVTQYQEGMVEREGERERNEMISYSGYLESKNY